MNRDTVQTDMGTRKPPPRFLTHDEIESIPSKRGALYQFRVRVWRGRDATPVVLVSQLPGGTQPHWMVIKLANYAQAVLAGYPQGGMLYFADEESHVAGRRDLTQSYFEFYGTISRLKLYRPYVMAKEWTFLEYLLDQKIER